MLSRCNILNLWMVVSICVLALPSFAAPSDVNLTVALSEAVMVDTGSGTPRIAVDVGGVTRYATYSAGTGTASLTFAYTPVAGDVDLDGITLSSPIDLNGGSISDLNGNPMTDLTFALPNTSGIKINYPSLSMDFTADTDGRYTLNGAVYDDLSSFLTAAGGTFTRASTATYYDASGVLQTAAANEARIDHDPVTHVLKGLMVEEARTNLVENSEFSGAALGSVAPANIAFGAGTGVTYSITDFGTLNGESFIEVRFVGTNTSGSTFYPNVSFGIFSPAAQGETWVGRVHVISSTGTIPNGAVLQLAELTAADGYLAANNQAISSGVYMTTSRTLTNASVAKTRFIILTTLLNGEVIDWTLKVSVPQVEKADFLTSYIPTVGVGAVTRDEEVLNIPAGSWHNQPAGAMYQDMSWETVAGTGFPMFLRLDDASSNNRWNIFYNQNNTRLSASSYLAGVNQATWNDPRSTSDTAKVAMAQTLNDTNVAFDGILMGQDTSFTPPPVTQLRLYNANANRWYKNIKYYPLRVSDTQLQLMTQ